MTEPQARKRPAWLPFAVVGAGVAALMVFFGVVSAPDNAPPVSPETFNLSGELRLDSTGAHFAGDNCTGDGGYSDISPGALVTVFDASGTVLGTGPLQSGSHEPGACVFRFSVAGVPRGESYYQVEVSHRGKVPVQEDDATLGRTSLTLG